MSTNNKGEASVATELERLQSERYISESVVSGERDRYASELGSSDVIEQMRRVASIQPKTYRIPRRVKKEQRPFIVKLRKLFGLE